LGSGSDPGPSFLRNMRDRGEQGSLQLGDKVFSGKKGYLYFSLPSRLLQHGHRGHGDWQLNGDSDSGLLESGPGGNQGFKECPSQSALLLHNGAATSAAVCGWLVGWLVH
jgi:hypothetical protein